MARIQKCLIVLVIAISLFTVTFAQVVATDTRYIRIGSLQSKINAYGAERAYNNIYYEGLTWPSDYLLQDNAVIERTMMGCQNFTDSKEKAWDSYCIYYSADFVDEATYPVVHKQTAKFISPSIYVDGVDLTSVYSDDVDEIDESLIPDRVVTNVVNTKMGVTMTRRIYAFSQQYHDNYFIIEYTFKNTGYVNYENTKVLDEVIKGFRFGFMNRYSVCREGADIMGSDQEWGKHSWATRRGEDYPQHASEVASLTENSIIPTWLRAGFEYSGQRDVNSYSTIGSPDVIHGTGRLCSPQFAGMVTIHVDKSTSDRVDDENQPCVLGWHSGDEIPKLGDMTEASPHNAMYKLLSGIPYTAEGAGNPQERMDEVYGSKITDPYKVHGKAAGTGVWIGYGPWDIAQGDSIVLVVATAVNGLDRDHCWEIGKRWYQAHQNSSDLGPFTLPDGSTTTDEDVYKNDWVMTGKDSIMKSFSRAIRNYSLGFNIPEPPQPPTYFDVTSGGDRISLKWGASPSENEAGFIGYKIYRSVGASDTTFDELVTVPAGTTNYDDMTPQRGFSYYYYICAYNDGSNNTQGKANPTGSLMSSRFYTKTTTAAYLKRAPGPLPQSISGNINVSAIKDTNYIRLFPNSGLASINAAISEFKITILNNEGSEVVVSAPDSLLPFRLSEVTDTAKFMLVLDSATVANMNQSWYDMKISNISSSDAVLISVNNEVINLPDTSVTPYKKWIDAVRIVPNPYNIMSAELQFPGEPDKIMFYNIPGHCLIRIFTENGDLVKTISHEDGSGDETWLSNTSSGQVVVSGVYIIHFTVTEDFIDPLTGEMKYRKGESTYQKCIIIR